MFESLWKAISSLFSQSAPSQKPMDIPKPIDTYANRNANRKALLDTIGWAEGTIQIPNSDNGYKADIGGSVFDDYSRHPNRPVWVNRIGKFSTAAGRYQIIYSLWQAYVVRLGLKDFSPPYQDICALNALREINALDDIDAGRFDSAIIKCGQRWASLPGPLGQAIRTVDETRAYYISVGGTVSS